MSRGRGLAALRGTQGDTLIEVLAAVLLLGFIALGVFQWTATATRFVDQDQEEAQALRYARAGVQQIRVTALQDYSTNGSLPTTVTPPTLAPVHGVAYTETIGAATTPAWDNDPTVVGVHEYVVTVSWSVAGGTDHVSLTAVVDPPVVNL